MILITLRFLTGNEINLYINSKSELSLNQEIINTGYFESEEYIRYQEKQFADGLKDLKDFLKITMKDHQNFVLQMKPVIKNL